MRPSRTWQWILALLLGTALAGCKSSSSHNYPSDPLLASKRPVEAKARLAPPTQAAATSIIVPPARVNLIACRKDTPEAKPSIHTTAIEPPPHPHPAGTDLNAAARAVSE